MLYVTGFVLGAPWLLYKAITTGKYRKGFFQRLGDIRRRSGDRPCVWFHSVSVGELLAAEQLIQRFIETHPDCQVVLSVTTQTGREIAAKRFPDLNVFFYPVDLTWVVRSVLAKIRPAVIVLIELELWPNLLDEAAGRHIPVVVVNGRISRKSYLYYSCAWFALRKAFHSVTCWGVQSDEYRKRLTDLGINSREIVVAGTTKYDAIPTEEDSDLRLALRAELKLSDNDLVLVGGSTFAGEEEVLLDIFLDERKAFGNLKLILVPRHPERWEEVRALLDGRGVSWQNRTTLRDDPSVGSVDVILLDTMGELGKIYAAGDVVFVGKSLCGKGGQNMLEPAARGRAVLFGPHVANFRETVGLLLDQDAAVQVADRGELKSRIRELLDSPERRHELGWRARQCIEGAKGATDRYLEMLENVLSKERKE